MLAELAKLGYDYQEGVRYGALYMDRWGSEQREDLAITSRPSLLEYSAAIVADQFCGQEPAFTCGIWRAERAFRPG